MIDTGADFSVILPIHEDRRSPNPICFTSFAHATSSSSCPQKLDFAGIHLNSTITIRIPTA